MVFNSVLKNHGQESGGYREMLGMLQDLVFAALQESLWGWIVVVPSVYSIFSSLFSSLQSIPRGALAQPPAVRTRRMQMAGLWSSMWRLPVVPKVRMVFLALALYRKHALRFCVLSLTHPGPDAKPIEVNRELPFTFSGFWIRLKNVLTGDSKLAPWGNYGLAQCIAIK